MIQLRRPELPYRAAAVLALTLAVWSAAACTGTGASEDPSPTRALPTATATPDRPNLTIFRGFIYPITGACLPQSGNLMPNAPREYRGGIHEGVDLYGIDNCTTIEAGTPAVAGKDGVVIRADHDYQPLTQEELATAEARIANGGANDFDVIDLFRGRQVWIDHGDGVVTRYVHLGSIPPEIREGVRVVQGQTVAFVGDSGTPESISSPGTESHLHWELRAGDSYLGENLPADEVRAIYTALFQPVPE